jgi:hypothetical protein
MLGSRGFFRGEIPVGIQLVNANIREQPFPSLDLNSEKSGRIPGFEENPKSCSHRNFFSGKGSHGLLDSSLKQGWGEELGRNPGRDMK